MKTTHGIDNEFLIQMAQNCRTPTPELLGFADTLTNKGRFRLASQDDIERFDKLLNRAEATQLGGVE